MEKKELKRMSVVLQELGLSYAETIEVMHEISKDMNNAQKLWRGKKKSKLLKLALTLITFPEPTPISDISINLFPSRSYTSIPFAFL